MKNKIHIYSISALLAVLVLTFMRSVSLISCYDTHIGYFNSSLLVTITNLATFLAVVWLMSSAFVVQKNTTSAPIVFSKIYNHIATQIAAAIYLISSIYILLDAENNLVVFAGASALISAIYYILMSINKPSTNTLTAFLSMLPTVTLALTAISVYFDMKISMNSPHKVMASFILLCAMVFSLCETRSHINRASPKVHFASGLVTFLLGFTYSASNLIYLLTQTLSDFEKRPLTLGNIGFIGITAAISIYAFFRCLSFENDSLPEEEKDQNTN